MNPIMMRCYCGFAKHWTWSGFISCIRRVDCRVEYCIFGPWMPVNKKEKE